MKAGAAILDIERSEVYRTFIAKSSVLAQQFDNSVSISYSSVQSSLNLVEENEYVFSLGQLCHLTVLSTAITVLYFV